MLDDLDRIPWSTLEHAYGDAGDVPNLLRAMVSSDPNTRAWAEDVLDMGPFHQGSLYSCTPFVVRVLLQLVQEEKTPEIAWILEYVSQIADAALSYFPVAEPVPADPEQAYAAQILAEVRAHWPLVLSLLNHPDGQIRLALLRLLVLLRSDVPQLEDILAEQLTNEAKEGRYHRPSRESRKQAHEFSRIIACATCRRPLRVQNYPNAVYYRDTSAIRKLDCAATSPPVCAVIVIRRHAYRVSR
jgi:hypothetical protein